MKHTPLQSLSFKPTMLAAIGVLVLASCGQSSEDRSPAGEGGWLTGNTHEKFQTVADQFGGFSQTMVEVGYRYTELYWAGEDENWPFAEYQIEHIEEAMQAGFQRRPERKASAELFMSQALPELLQAVRSEDQAAFRQSFESLSVHCNACHAKEDVAFVNVGIPTQRVRPWGTQQ